MHDAPVNRPTARQAFRIGILLSLFQPVPLLAQESPDIQYAQRMPLAAQSLLLDVTSGPGGVLVAVGERGHIVWSTDGETWQQAETVPANSTLTSITAVGDRLWAAGHDSTILTSGDAGRNWTRQHYDPDRQQPIMDILFLDADHGIAVGAYGLYLVSFDGGVTWEDGTVSDEEWHFNALARLDDGRLFIAGEAGYSYLSEDAGETWTLLELPYQGSMWGAVTLAGGCFLAHGLRGHVLQSCDNGQNWQAPETGTQASLTGSVFDGQRTVLVGNSGTVVERDGDGPFAAALHPSGVDFAAVIARGDGRYLLVGEDGVHHWPVPTGENAGP